MVHPAVDKWVAHRGLKTALCWTIGKPIPHYAHRRTDARAVDNKRPLPTALLALANFLIIFHPTSQGFDFPKPTISIPIGCVREPCASSEFF